LGYWVDVGIDVLTRRIGVPRQNIALLLALLFLSFSSIQAADVKKPKSSARPAVLSEHDRALHAVERLTFGPRPGDLEKVLSMGLDHWLEQQLNPGQIPDPVLDSRLANYPTLRMSAREAAQNFPSGQMIAEAAQKKRAMPSDPVQFGLWEVL